MTIQQVHDEQTRRMAAGETTYNGRSSAAVGAGQFLTPLEQVRAMYEAQGRAFDPNKVLFDEKLQNELILDLAKRKRGVDVSKRLTEGDFQILGDEWASFTPKHGQTSRTARQTLGVYDDNLGEARANAPSARQSGSSTGGQAYGTGLKTGPSAYIGGSTGHHIDTKLKSDMSMESTVAYFDQMARAYEEQGRVIEFSNNAVAGERYKSTMSMQEKIALLRRAAGAHASRAGYSAFDYFVPLESAPDRYHHSAEGAEIQVPTAPGGHIDYHSGGRYGNFVIIYDSSGREIGRTGHGDTRYGRSSGRVQTPAQAPPPAQVNPPVERSSNAENVSRRAEYEDPKVVLAMAGGGNGSSPAVGGGGGTLLSSSGGQSANEMSNTYLRAIMANNMYKNG